ncbi:short-chain dehydrogenase [Sedimentitalea sp. CY04]|uniref:Short-chain dehydrogenase n=1 Tax=Parasedimentitalea denitrificans TaxID=2211118 RepID=A0ABX0WGF4_9RHOB|nr:NnrS family protein [Sedimentitalea sp. CY04]NIZ63481.1 short-chain dehydrogenase [Sedimentitalea sp. CY04]
MTPRKEYTGPTLLSYGFRPFFLLALGFSCVSILLWMLMYQGDLSISGPFQPVDWHIHEMLFGYTSAVITGFLFTAIPNWTGRMPVRGWPLGALALLWVAGRLSVAGALPLSFGFTMVVDCGYLAAILAIVLREIIVGKNWRNLMVVCPIGLFFISNVMFYIEVMQNGESDHARRLGFAVVIFLIVLIGGRIIPSFTRNWLVKNNPGPLPTPMNSFDKLCLVSAAVALLLWVGAPEWLGSRGTLVVAASLHFARLLRWQGLRARTNMLLLMLHIAYAFTPLGLLLLAVDQTVSGLHILGIGAIGGMTLAVMIRATMGHTGRELASTWDLSLAFIILILAAVVRSALVNIAPDPMTVLWTGAILWTVAYGLVLVRIGPWYLGQNPARRKPS